MHWAAGPGAPSARLLFDAGEAVTTRSIAEVICLKGFRPADIYGHAGLYLDQPRPMAEVLPWALDRLRDMYVADRLRLTPADRLDLFQRSQTNLRSLVAGARRVAR